MDKRLRAVDLAGERIGVRAVDREETRRDAL
jgi:hypothetical protein